MIDVTKFTEEVRDRRPSALALVGSNPLIATYRDALRIVCDEDAWRVSQPVEPVLDRSYEGHMNELRVAAFNAYTYGATDAQVRLLARLSADAGEIVGYASGRLTKAEASRQIDQMKRDAVRRAN